MKMQAIRIEQITSPQGEMMFDYFFLPVPEEKRESDWYTASLKCTSKSPTLYTLGETYEVTLKVK